MGGWKDIAGKTASSLTIAAVTKTQDGSQYRCVVTNTQGVLTTTATSGSATLNVQSATVTGGDPGGNPSPQTGDYGSIPLYFHAAVALLSLISCSVVMIIKRLNKKRN